MADPRDRPPKRPADAGKPTEPPPPFNPRLDLIGYMDGDEKGLPPRRPFWSGLWKRRRPPKSER